MIRSCSQKKIYEPRNKDTLRLLNYRLDQSDQQLRALVNYGIFLNLKDVLGLNHIELYQGNCEPVMQEWRTWASIFLVLLCMVAAIQLIDDNVR